MSKDIYFPGDFITVIEEFFPGEGIFEEKGRLYASIVGILKSDLKERRLDIHPLKKPRSFLRKGDVVIAKVIDIGRNLVELLILYNETQAIEVNLRGYMLLKRREDEEVGEFIKITDFIRARVLSHEGYVILSIKGKDFGVIYAECPNCGNAMVYNEEEKRTLKCNECGHRVKTKVSAHYILKS